MIIDGDGHFVEPLSLWRDYIPATLHDRIHVDCGDDGFAQRIVMGDFALPLDLGTRGAQKVPLRFGDLLTPGGMKRDTGRRFEEAEPGGWDSEARLKVHDAEGLDGAVLFPTIGLATYQLKDPEIATAVTEGINRFAADYCSVAPDELKANAMLPTSLPEIAAEELRRSVEEHGHVAGCVWAGRLPDGRYLDHPSFEPLWNMAEELDFPISVHGGAHHWPGVTSMALTHAIVHPFDGMVAFGALYQAGVFDRHPRLRIGFFESGCGWAPFWCERLDEHAEAMGWMNDPPITRKATDVFRERCVVGCEGEEKMPPYVQEWFGEESVIWASDYPHYDVEPPYLEDVLERTDMTDSQRDGLLCRSTAKFYNLDTEAIARSNVRRRGSGD